HGSFQQDVEGLLKVRVRFCGKEIEIFWRLAFEYLDERKSRVFFVYITHKVRHSSCVGTQEMTMLLAQRSHSSSLLSFLRHQSVSFCVNSLGSSVVPCPWSDRR